MTGDSPTHPGRRRKGRKHKGKLRTGTADSDTFNPLSGDRSLGRSEQRVLSKEALLNNILLLTEEYLNHPDTLSPPVHNCFQSLFQSLRAEGLQYQHRNNIGVRLPQQGTSEYNNYAGAFEANAAAGNSGMSSFARSSRLLPPLGSLQSNYSPMEMLLRNQQTFQQHQQHQQQLLFQQLQRQNNPAAGLILGQLGRHHPTRSVFPLMAARPQQDPPSMEWTGRAISSAQVNENAAVSQPIAAPSEGTSNPHYRYAMASDLTSQRMGSKRR